ncbi:MAG: hypothetical protein V1790_04625, partial [Planctomycetota bacterium]
VCPCPVTPRAAYVGALECGQVVRPAAQTQVWSHHTMNQIRQKWERWLEDIRQQLHAVMRSRLVLRETFALIRDNPNLPPSSLIYHHLRAWYGDHAIMALRRQIKDSRQSTSFVRLLNDIQPESCVIPV